MKCTSKILGFVYMHHRVKKITIKVDLAYGHFMNMHFTTYDFLSNKYHLEYNNYMEGLECLLKMGVCVYDVY